MAIEHLTPHHPEPDALQSVLEIDACLTQARAIVRLMSAAAPDEAMPRTPGRTPPGRFSDLLKRIDHAAGKLGRLASAREA